MQLRGFLVLLLLIVIGVFLAQKPSEQSTLDQLAINMQMAILRGPCPQGMQIRCLDRPGVTEFKKVLRECQQIFIQCLQ